MGYYIGIDVGTSAVKLTALNERVAPLSRSLNNAGRSYQMKILDVTIITPVGIHARNALLLSRLAARFRSSIYLEKDGRKENARNVMAVMALRIRSGDRISFVVNGIDEDQVIAELRKFCDGNL